MRHFNHEDITELETRYRAKLINSLSGFKSANLIGTINSQGQTNLAIFSSVVHLGASPALIGFIVRPDSAERHTLENIKQTKSYTINQVNSSFWQQAHQTSARFDKHESEFDKTGLTAEFWPNIKAPFVEESLLKYALTLKEILPIKLNGTSMIIGEVSDIICTDSSIKRDGYIDIESLNTVTVSSLDSYHKTKHLGRLKYAKPNSETSFLDINGE